MDFEDIKTMLADYFSGKPVLCAYLFGSYTRDQQTQKSDPDILVELDYDNGGASFDNWCNMQDDLAIMFNKRIDLVSANGLSKFIAHHINESKKLVYDQQRPATA